MPAQAPTTRDRLLGFELQLDALVCDTVVAHRWGRAFLTPSLPHVWDASWVLIERPGLAVVEVGEIADAALAGCEHRTVAFRDEADGERAAAGVTALPGWEVESTLYMTWEGWPEGEAGPRGAHEVAEARFAECEGLRRQLIREGLPAGPDRDETAAQLLEMDRRYGSAGGERWFLAPADEPASACRLLGRGGTIRQVEEVATLAAARGRGLARATVEAAIAAALADGAETIFLSADAADWPQVFYARLGFAPAGGVTVLRRKPI